MLTTSVEQGTTSKNRIAFILIVSLFFLWALTSNLLPILIPHFKKAFNLQYLKASLVDWAYWISYFVFAIPSGIIMKKSGYKTTIVMGLTMAAIGAFLFPVAANASSYLLFLISLFIVASGMTFLETAANPYIRSFGSPETYSQRLNFAQAFNGLGAVVATNILSHLILSDSIVKGDEEINAMDSVARQEYFHTIIQTVKLPYIMIGVVLLSFAIAFLLVKMPTFEGNDKNKKVSFFNPFKFPQLSQSMVAQFFYVGAQVCVSSFFISYAITIGNLSVKIATTFLGLLLICFMSGRYIGAGLMRKYDPVKLLWIFASANVVLCLIVVMSGGRTGVAAFFGIEFFMSIMYPTIFSIGVKSMGDKIEIASSYMVMTILGGALLPILLGYISDSMHSVRYGYFVPVICFIIIAIFAKNQLKKEKAETS